MTALQEIVIRLLQDLVRVDTANPPGNELNGAHVLGQWLEDRGIPVEIDEFSSRRANLKAWIKGASEGPVLMLNSHLDVVPHGSHWNYGPCSGVIEGGCVYGRGAADAKGSLAAMAGALVAARDGGIVRRGELILTAVADEEVGSEGARRLLSQIRPDFAVVGEPTDLRLITAHKGTMRPVVEFGGRGAHAATPKEGINAIELAADFLHDILRQYSKTLEGRPHPLVGPPTISAVFIEGGQALNVVPDRCRIIFDRRLVPGETFEDALAEFGALVHGFGTRRPGAGAEIVELKPTTGGPSETPSDHPFVVVCQRTLGRRGLSPAPAGLAVNCDMTHFRDAGIPTVVFGPGETNIAHKPNEYVRIPDVAVAQEVYLAIAEEVLGDG